MPDRVFYSIVAVISLGVFSSVYTSDGRRYDGTPAYQEGAEVNRARAEINKTIAFMIGVNGFACTRILEVRRLEAKHRYDVRCAATPEGKRSARYLFAIEDNGITVEKL